MRPTDQVDAVVRQSIQAADAARADFRATVRKMRMAPETAQKRARRPHRDELLAQADRDGAVTPRVLLPADYADATTHPRTTTFSEPRTSDPLPAQESPDDDQPGFGTGWLTNR